MRLYHFNIRFLLASFALKFEVLGFNIFGIFDIDGYVICGILTSGLIISDVM